MTVILAVHTAGITSYFIVTCASSILDNILEYGNKTWSTIHAVHNIAFIPASPHHTTWIGAKVE